MYWIRNICVEFFFFLFNPRHLYAAEQGRLRFNWILCSRTHFQNSFLGTTMSTITVPLDFISWSFWRIHSVVYYFVLLVGHISFLSFFGSKCGLESRAGSQFTPTTIKWQIKQWWLQEEACMKFLPRYSQW